MKLEEDGSLELVQRLQVMKVGQSYSPHKYLLLLALGRLYAQDPRRSNEFPLTPELLDTFADVCRQVCGEGSEAGIFIEYPYYHLSTDGIWALTLREGKEEAFRAYEESPNRRLTLKRLVETVEYGCLREDVDQLMRVEASRNALVSELTRLASACAASSRPSLTLERISFSAEATSAVNPFVAYLNSLQRLNADNENSLAESQACSPFFPDIQVPHPVARLILAELRLPEGRHVILTGHAGDGKSTVALEVYKQLTGIPLQQPLTQRQAPREDLPGLKVSIVKDLSERLKEDDAALVAELLRGDRRFLLVSNTGTLLDLLRSQAPALCKSEVEIESDVLGAISAEHGEGQLRLGKRTFLVLNLARMDNLELARQIFERMISAPHWKACDVRPCRSSCPVLLNVALINRHKCTILERLFLTYRRMYEYGTRLTLRQITEHLSYMITSGLEEADIAAMRESQQEPLKAEFMFFNRFFGDNGIDGDPEALRMRAVAEIRQQGLGERLCPLWERKLWLKAQSGDFRLDVEDCDSEFERLRKHGSKPGNDSSPGLTPDQAREQVRRMLYFLYDFDEHDPSYLRQFLNSPTILRWREWQRPGAVLDVADEGLLEQRVYHVLQEHFTGVRLPEGAAGHDRRLYITLNRGRHEIRQSAQVVLAQIDWSSQLSLKLVQRPNAAGEIRTDLELQGRGDIAGAALTLTLPFLDYVVMRHFGELGETLEAAYVERLERFKAQIQSLTREAQSHVMLVRLKTDHTFRRQKYTVRDGVLEATNDF